MKVPFTRHRHAHVVQGQVFVVSEDAGDATPANLKKWVDSGSVVVISVKPGRAWIADDVSSEEYLEDSLESADKEARAEVQHFLEVAR